MRAFLRYEAAVAMDRNAALTAVADALAAGGGWIVDHTLFSDVMATIRFALPADRVGAFERALAGAGLPVGVGPVGTGPVATGPVGDASADELNGVIALTFTSGSGDLRRDVPAFS
ncbi:hypothetical protein ABMY26_16045 [Azospirillum sp. HJ39]|uniref:hypothetical protein n=1 Tax=Azospirillum sp. HJ39 TaxID=3159496 RepID=UPI0035571338